LEVGLSEVICTGLASKQRFGNMLGTFPRYAIAGKFNAAIDESLSYDGLALQSDTRRIASDPLTRHL
jgi:hypothetical protein